MLTEEQIKKLIKEEVEAIEFESDVSLPVDEDFIKKVKSSLPLDNIIDDYNKKWAKAIDEKMKLAIEASKAPKEENNNSKRLVKDIALNVGQLEEDIVSLKGKLELFKKITFASLGVSGLALIVAIAKGNKPKSKYNFNI